jgi:hypothetical protein
MTARAQPHCALRALICPAIPRPQASPTFCQERAPSAVAPSSSATIAVGVLPSCVSFVQLQSAAPAPARAPKPPRGRAHKQRRLRSDAPAHKKKHKNKNKVRARVVVVTRRITHHGTRTF